VLPQALARIIPPLGNFGENGDLKTNSDRLG